MALLVTYDLRGDTKDYSGLHSELKRREGWWHYLESTWILESEKSPAQLWARLKPHVG